MMTSEQLRAARALLRWEQRDLAEKSGVSLPSIKRLEAKPGELAAQASTVGALAKAIEAAGVRILADGEAGSGEGPGVRLMKRT
jgi:predicted transcriptional regulator